MKSSGLDFLIPVRLSLSTFYARYLTVLGCTDVDASVDSFVLSNCLFEKCCFGQLQYFLSTGTFTPLAPL